MNELGAGSAPDLERGRAELMSRLAAAANFVPGSLHEEWRRCGKVKCHCAKPGDRGHGPRFVLERRQGGKVRRVLVTPDQVERVRAGIGAWKRFETVRRQLIEVNAEVARRQLLAPDRATSGLDH